MEYNWDFHMIFAGYERWWLKELKVIPQASRRADESFRASLACHPIMIAAAELRWSERFCTKSNTITPKLTVDLIVG